MGAGLLARTVWSWAMMALVLSILVGCGHRSFHGSHQPTKTSAKTRTMTHPLASDATLPRGKGGSRTGGEGYFPAMEGTFSDLLDETTLGQDELNVDQEIGSTGSSNDYWVTRARAEQLTTSSGLQDIHFSFDSFQLTEEAKAILRANAEWMKVHPEAEVTIEGHCDNRGTSSYNYVLGEKRATRTKAYLASLGVSHTRLHVMTLGKDHPACWDPTEHCYQENRRAHLVLGLQTTSTAMR